MRHRFVACRVRKNRKVAAHGRESSTTLRDDSRRKHHIIYSLSGGIASLNHRLHRDYPYREIHTFVLLVLMHLHQRSGQVLAAENDKPLTL